jgi:hypothetical protein
MEKKVIKLEDLKEGMKLRSLKNVCYVDEMSLDDGLLLEEELFEMINWVIKKNCIWEVGVDEDEVYVIYDGESNEGWFDLEEVLEKGVFEII